MNRSKQKYNNWLKEKSELNDVNYDAFCKGLTEGCFDGFAFGFILGGIVVSLGMLLIWLF